MRECSHDIAFSRTGTGPAMLLVHGCPATRSLWSPLVPQLSRHRTLLAVDLPGFGESPAPPDRDALSLTRLARTLLGLADREGLERFDLVGHSFGGAIAAAVATEAPERVRSLTMITPMGCETPPAARLARTALVRSLVAPAWRLVPGSVRRALVMRSTQVNYGPAYSEERARQIARELDRGDALGAICALVGAFDYGEYRGRLERLERELDVPTLLVGAARDRVVPHRHFESLARLVARAERMSFGDGVHVVMWQHPREIAQRIVTFVEQASTQAAHG